MPERGSWIEVNVTKKDILAVRIDQSSKIAATTFLRAMDERYGSDEAIIREFYKVKTIKVSSLKPETYLVSAIVNEETGEEVVRAGCQAGDAVDRIKELGIKQVEVIDKVADPIILNTIAADGTRTYEEALLRIYSRLRPGNPPNADKAKKLFTEKFYDDNRYRLGKVGRFRLNRKFEQQVPEDIMTLRVEDFINSLKYLLLLRTGDAKF